MYLGQDFGYNHLNAILMVGARDGDLYILREHCTRGLSTREILAECDFPKRLPMYCDSAEPDRIAEFRAAGYRAMPVQKEKGSVGAQIDFLKRREIVVHPSCRELIDELSGWVWAKDIGGEPMDEPAPARDDAIAALRYAIEGLRKTGGRVRTVKGLRV